MRTEQRPLTNSVQMNENTEGRLELGQVLAALRRRILLIVGVTTVMASAAVLKALTNTPIYSASFEILTEPVTLETQIISAANPETLSNQEEIISAKVDATKLRILKSPRLIQPVVEDLKLKYPYISYGQIVGGLLTTSSAEDILMVTYQDPDAELVRDVLDLIADAYIEFSLENRQRDIRRGIDFVDEQLPELRARVEILQGDLEELRQKHNLIDPHILGQQLSSQVGALVQERLSTQIERNQAQLLYLDLQRELLQQGEAAAASALTQDPRYQRLLAELLAIDSQLAEQSTLFLEASPEIQLLLAHRQNLLPLLSREGQRVQRQAESHIRELNTRNQALAEAIDLLNQQIKQLSTVTRQYSDIQRELDLATNNLNQFLSKREALRIDAAQRQAPWELLSQRGEPKASLASAQRNLILGAGLGLLLGIGVALIVDKLSSVIYTVKEVKAATKLPLLGVIPFNQYLEKFGSAGSVAAQLQPAGHILGEPCDDVRLKQSFTPFIEACRSLYTNIRLISPDTQVHSLAISSAIPNAGKTTVSLHLGQAAAAMGQRVLIVDVDLRRPSLHTRLGIRDMPGLTDFVSADLSFEAVLQAAPIDNNLFVVTAGAIPLDPTKIISSKRMQQFMAQARQNFDLVLYDTPPLLGFADSYLIAAQTSGLLMVIGLGKLKRSLLERSLEELRTSGLAMLGVVANGSKDRTTPTYNYYQYYAQKFDGRKILERRFDQDINNAVDKSGLDYTNWEKFTNSWKNIIKYKSDPNS